MKRIEYLDYARALAILPVTVVHYYSPALPAGALGVAVFFALSGYFITSLIEREDAAPVSLYMSFVVRRMMRILPMYFAVVTVSLLALYHRRPEALNEIDVASLFLMMSRPTQFGYSFLALWTLQVEFWVYLIFPIFYILIPHRMIILSCLFATSLFAWTLDLNSFPEAIRNVIVYGNTFILGALAFRFKDVEFEKGRRNIFAARVCLAFSVFGILGCYFFLTKQGLLAHRYLWFMVTAAFAAIYIVIYPLANWKIRIPFFPSIALISYSIYLVHGMLLDNVIKGRSVEGYIQFLIMAFAVSATTYLAIELPTQKLGRNLASRLSNRRSPDNASAAQA